MKYSTRRAARIADSFQTAMYQSLAVKNKALKKVLKFLKDDEPNLSEIERELLQAFVRYIHQVRESNNGKTEEYEPL